MRNTKAEQRQEAIEELMRVLSPQNRSDALRAASYSSGDGGQRFGAWLDAVSPHLNWKWDHIVYLRERLDAVTTGDLKKLMIFMPPRHGKRCSHDTPVLTPKGWVNHGDLSVGDFVFHPSGKPVEVIAVAPEGEVDCRVRFSTGEYIDCHENHEWTVDDRSRRSGDFYTTSIRTMETKEIEASNISYGEIGKRGSRYRIQLANTNPLEMPANDLPIDPYWLGAWLGDGRSEAPVICSSKKDVAVLNACSDIYRHKSEVKHKDTGVLYRFYTHLGIIQEIRKLGIYKDKRIPQAYMFASVSQRLSLLAGLIDTDGSSDKHSRIRIVTVSLGLAEDISELVRTLGMRPYIMSQEPQLSSSGIEGKSTVYTVGFQPNEIMRDCPIVLKRKRPKRIPKKRRRAITGIERISPKMGKCIQVASDDGLYLVGYGLIPTHNSTLATIHYPAYRLEVDQSLNMMVCAYNQTLANRFSRRIQDIVSKRIPLNQKKLAADYWETAVGGAVRPAGVGGGITGMGADLIVIDDPIKNREEANSLSHREKVWDWYTDDLFTRKEPDSAMILINTRWHEDDLAGRILNSSDGANWEVVNLPAIAEEDDDIGRAPGEALCPDRFDIEALEEIKEVMGRGWYALYQQTPRQQDGDMFNREWFNVISKLPRFEDGHRILCRYWDKAGTKDGGSFSAGVLMMLFSRTFIICDIKFGQWSSTEREKRILQQALLDKQRFGTVVVGVEQEPGSGGKESAEATIKSLNEIGVSAFADKVTGEKSFRAEPMASTAEDGKIDILGAAWNKTFFDVAETFPNSKMNDIIDASSGAFNYLAQHVVDWDAILKVGRQNDSYQNRWL